MLDAVYNNGIKLFLWVKIMTVYVDILVFVNTLVNYFMLSAVRMITRESASRFRILAGALAGGVSSLLIFLNLGILMSILKIAVSVLMILISFKYKGFRRFLKENVWLFLISFIFGGVMLFINTRLKTDALIYSNGIVYFDIDMTFLVVCSVISYLVISLISKLTDKKAPKEKEYYVTLSNNGKVFSDTALMDTGNNLREPFSGYPVILIDKKIFRELFGGNSLRLIPAATVNGESVIKAFKPDSVKIGGYTAEHVYIGESAVPMDEYKIILNINLWEEIRNAKTQTAVR